MSEISKYLAEIGSRGGRKSRRVLNPAQAQEMVKVREARRAYKKFHSLCFWSYDPAYLVTKNDLSWVADQLQTYGGHNGYVLGAKICP